MEERPYHKWWFSKTKSFLLMPVSFCKIDRKYKWKEISAKKKWSTKRLDNCTSIAYYVHPITFFSSVISHFSSESVSQIYRRNEEWMNPNHDCITSRKKSEPSVFDKPSASRRIATKSMIFWIWMNDLRNLRDVAIKVICALIRKTSFVEHRLQILSSDRRK